jgi:DNA repair protein RadC
MNFNSYFKSITPFIRKNHRSNLRMRFLRNGLHGFGEHEVLEFLLTYVIPRKDVKPIAVTLLEYYSSTYHILSMKRKNLEKFVGLGKKSATFIKLINEGIKLYFQQKFQVNQCNISMDRNSLKRFLYAEISKINYGTFKVVYFDAKFSVMCDGIECLGEILCTPQTFQKLFNGILTRECYAVLICRSAMDKNITPTEHDRRLLCILQRILGTISICLVDYFILCNNKAYSLCLQKIF